MSLWKQIAEAVARLKNNQVVAIPTETVYGLAGRISSPQAIDAIFTLKERPSFDPLIVHVKSVAQAKSLTTQWPAYLDTLLKEYWPGPLTVVLPKAACVLDRITAEHATVGLRMPAHPVARRVIREVGEPLAAPSANRFKKTSATTADHVRVEFPKADLWVIDGGPCQTGIESTVALCEDDQISILRPGAILPSHLRNSLNRSGFNIRVSSRPHEDVLGLSPGTLQEHYRPQKPLVILPESFCWDGPSQEKLLEGIQCAPQDGIEIKLPDSAVLAARDLYRLLREHSERPGKFLIIKRSPKHSEEIWVPIWDRLQRAASLNFSL